MSLAERIKQARAYAQLNQRELADRVPGLSQQNLSKMEQGRSQHTRLIIPIARACGVSAEWLESGRGRMVPARANEEPAHYSATPIVEWEDPEDLDPDSYAMVPRRRVQLHCGNGVTIDEDPHEPPLAFKTSWLKSIGARRSDLVVVDAVGDSMSPYINHGDSVLVDTSKRELAEGQTYAIRYGDEVRIKALRKRYDGGLILNSYNELYDDESIPPDALNQLQVEIIGQVVWRGGTL